MSSNKRIAKELGEVTSNPPAGTAVTLPPSNDIHVWHVTMSGPPGTAYAGGNFAVVIRLPTEYPFKPPTVRFATRIYHPNITNDSLGNICLGVLKAENWKPSTRLVAVIEALRQLLAEPQPDDPLETRIAEEYRSNRAEFEKNVRDYVSRYATGLPEFRE